MWQSKRLTKFLFITNIILLCFMGFSLYKFHIYEKKIKFLDKSIQCVMITEFGKDTAGMKLWQKMLKTGMVDKLFSW